MTWSVDQVEYVTLAVRCGVIDPHRISLDRYSSLPLNVHTVKHLRLHITLLDRSSLLNQPISQRGFTVVNMRHDREVTDVRKRYHYWDME